MTKTISQQAKKKNEKPPGFIHQPLPPRAVHLSPHPPNPPSSRWQCQGTESEEKEPYPTLPVLLPLKFPPLPSGCCSASPMGWTGLKERTKGKGGRLGESGAPLASVSYFLLMSQPSPGFSFFFMDLEGMTMGAEPLCETWLLFIGKCTQVINSRFQHAHCVYKLHMASINSRKRML